MVADCADMGSKGADRDGEAVNSSRSLKVENLHLYNLCIRSNVFDARNVQENHDRLSLNSNTSQKAGNPGLKLPARFLNRRRLTYQSSSGLPQGCDRAIPQGQQVIQEIVRFIGEGRLTG